MSLRALFFSLFFLSCTAWPCCISQHPRSQLRRRSATLINVRLHCWLQEVGSDPVQWLQGRCPYLSLWFLPLALRLMVIVCFLCTSQISGTSFRLPPARPSHCPNSNFAWKFNCSLYTSVENFKMCMRGISGVAPLITCWNGAISSEMYYYYYLFIVHVQLCQFTFYLTVAFTIYQINMHKRRSKPYSIRFTLRWWPCNKIFNYPPSGI